MGQNERHKFKSIYARQGWRNLSPANVMETPIEKEISPVQIRLYAVVSPLSWTTFAGLLPPRPTNFSSSGSEQVKLKKRAPRIYGSLYFVAVASLRTTVC